MQSVENDKLTFVENRVYCIHENKITPKKRFGMVRPDRRGLSGEHIELCAEGARCKPNLSGKRTETHDPDQCRAVLFGLRFLFLGE